jgi:hypothetical protein
MPFVFHMPLTNGLEKKSVLSEVPLIVYKKDTFSGSLCPCSILPAGIPRSFGHRSPVFTVFLCFYNILGSIRSYPPNRGQSTSDQL